MFVQSMKLLCSVFPASLHVTLLSVFVKCGIVNCYASVSVCKKGLLIHVITLVIAGYLV